MFLLLIISISILLLLIAYFDFRQYSFYAWIVPLLILGLMTKALVDYTFESFMSVTITNLLIVAIQILLLFLYYRLKKTSDGFFQSFFGWGDVWMLVVLAVSFHPQKLLVFEVVSLLTTVLLVYMIKRQRNSMKVPVPLAGVWSLGVFAVLVLEQLNLISPLLTPQLK